MQRLLYVAQYPDMLWLVSKPSLFKGGSLGDNSPICAGAANGACHAGHGAVSAEDDPMAKLLEPHSWLSPASSVLCPASS